MTQDQKSFFLLVTIANLVFVASLFGWAYVGRDYALVSFACIAVALLCSAFLFVPFDYYFEVDIGIFVLTGIGFMRFLLGAFVFVFIPQTELQFVPMLYLVLLANLAVLA